MLRSTFCTGKRRIKHGFLSPSKSIENLWLPSPQQSFSSVIAIFRDTRQYPPGISSRAAHVNPWLSYSWSSPFLGPPFTGTIGPNSNNLPKVQYLNPSLGVVMGYPELLRSCSIPGHNFSGVDFLANRTIGAPQQKGIRWFSSNGGGTEKDTTSKSDPSRNPDAKMEGLKEETPTGKKGEEDAKKDSLDPRAFLLGTREHLKKVTEWEVGDVVATYSIVLLLLTIVLSPIVGK